MHWIFVQVGDEVWAYNSETGETELKEVLNVWIKETDEILHVSTSDGEIIDTTTNHPFYVEDKGWVAAGDLEIGDILVTADGDEVEVTDVEIEKLDEPILVYNLEVEDFHTYFVGEYGVLVHNICHGHHSDPKYLGGEPKQPLTTIPEEIHYEIHKMIDKIFPRKSTAAYYAEQLASDPNFKYKIKYELEKIYFQYIDTYPDLIKDFLNNFGLR